MDQELIDESLLPEARRMSQLLQDLLLLARSDEGALGLRWEDVDIDDLLEAEAARLSGNGTVSVATEIRACRVTGDRAALTRVIRNLVDNAARYARSTVTLSCRPVPDGVVITIADDGPGIPAGNRSRIFERFVRLDAARARASGGTGLGLAIVAEVVRAHREPSLSVMLPPVVRCSPSHCRGRVALIKNRCPSAAGSRRHAQSRWWRARTARRPCGADNRCRPRRRSRRRCSSYPTPTAGSRTW